jgi:hypothetical protein
VHHLGTSLDLEMNMKTIAVTALSLTLMEGVCAQTNQAPDDRREQFYVLDRPMGQTRIAAWTTKLENA